MNILIPFISAVLFRLGGVSRDDRFLPFMKPSTPIAAKAWRWGMGAIIGLLAWHGWLTYLLIIATYFLATWALGYGENHPFRKWFGRDASWIIYGALFSLASFPVLRWLAILQAIIGAWVFWFLMKWSNDGMFPVDSYDLFDKTGNGWKLNHAWVEIGIGFLGTIFYIFAR